MNKEDLISFLAEVLDLEAEKAKVVFDVLTDMFKLIITNELPDYIGQMESDIVNRIEDAFSNITIRKEHTL